MKLYYSPTSPYVRKVRVVAIERGLADRIELVALSPFEDAERLSSANPLMKVPALAREDGPSLFDSPVICEYLDALGPEAGRLIPQSGEPRWRTLRMQALADGVLDAAFSLVMERRRPEAERSASWSDRWSDGIRRAVAAAAADGPPARLDLGAIALGCALGYLDFRLDELGWRSIAPALADWYSALDARTSFAATRPA